MGEPEAAAANADPNKKDPNADLYETKPPKKLIRLVTVVAYMFSVSFVAIVLSAYYLFLWVPPDPKLLRRPNHLAAEPDLNFMVADDPPSDEIPLLGAGNFAGRIAGDDVDAKSRLNKRHENLNESLLILRMFLTEQQRMLRHDSAESSSSKERLESETRTEKTLLVANSTTIFAKEPQGFIKEEEHIPRGAEGTRWIMQLPRKMSTQNLNSEKLNPETGIREHKPSNEIRFAGDERKDKLYESKHKQKLVRVLTVVAYVIFVSMGAILVSLYYTFVWDPKDVNVTTVRIRQRPECVNTKLPNPLTTPSNVNETQLEKVTVRSVSDKSKRTKEPEVATTTSSNASPPKNLLTILTTVATSSSASTELTPRDFTTNPNTETRESLTTNTSPGND